MNRVYTVKEIDTLLDACERKLYIGDKDNDYSHVQELARIYLLAGVEVSDVLEVVREAEEAQEAEEKARDEAHERYNEERKRLNPSKKSWVRRIKDYIKP